MKEIESLLQQAVDVAAILDRIPFDDKNAVAAALAQPTLFLEAARLRVQSGRQRAAADMEVKTLRAKLSLAIRAKAAQVGDKITEGAIKEKLDTLPEVRKAEKNLSDLEAQEEFCKLLLEGLRQRKDMIWTVQNTNNAEMRMLDHIDSATALDDLRKKLHAKYPGRP
jgi:hypothetical protein